MNAVTLDQLGRQVGGAVGDDATGGMGAAADSGWGGGGGGLGGGFGWGRGGGGGGGEGVTARGRLAVTRRESGADVGGRVRGGLGGCVGRGGGGGGCGCKGLDTPPSDWPRPSSPERPASSGPTWRGCWSSVATSVRLGVEDGSPDTAIADLDCNPPEAGRARPALGPARPEGRRARVPLRGCDLRPPGGRGAALRRERGRHEARDGGVPAGRGGARGLHLERRGGGPAANGKAATETQLFTAARLGIPYVNSVHEAEVEAMRVAAHGLPLVCVNPAVCLGRRRSPAVLDPAGAQLPAGAHPRLHRRRNRDRLRARRRRRAPARGHSAAPWASATCSPAATSPSSACSPTSGGCPACRPRSASRRGPRRRPPPCWEQEGARGRSPPPRCVPPGTAGPTAPPRRSACSAGGHARTRRPSRRRSPGTWSASTTASRARAARSRSSTGWRVWRWERPRARPGLYPQLAPLATFGVRRRPTQAP